TAPITTTTTTRPTTTTTTRPTTTTTRPTTTQPTSRITTTIPTTGGNNPMLQQGSHTDNAVAAPKNGEADPRAVLSYKMNAVDGYFYNENDSWQRNFGFMKAYDQAAQFAMMFYDTVRFRFTADGHDWQVQIWKGQYGFMFLGVEVGVYFLPEGRARDQSWYRCVPDEYRLNMTTAMFVDGKFMAKRPFQEYWWCTTFVPGNLERNSDRSKIRMEWVVEMRSDAMADAFEQSVIAHGFAKASESYNSILKNGFKHSDEYARNGKRFALNWLLIGAPRPNSSRAY
ncbi:MAG: DUF4474 domain-containing protein, partial [Oscillospiraceae bacterium]|nr:DUF4474 domain-containing protein [Oscillospiraceae bacterium]